MYNGKCWSKSFLLNTYLLIANNIASLLFFFVAAASLKVHIFRLLRAYVAMV